MELIGLGGKFLNVIKALSSNDNFQVSINGHLSRKVFPKRGLKQGCVLSPLLFALYISDLGKILENGSRKNLHSLGGK